MSVEFGALDPSRAAQVSEPSGWSPRFGLITPSPRSPANAAPPADGEQGEDAAAERERARSLLDRLNASGPNLHARLSIDHDDEVDAYVYRILDSRSGEVVRQFPQEETLELMRFLGKQQGLIVDHKT